MSKLVISAAIGLLIGLLGGWFAGEYYMSKVHLLFGKMEIQSDITWHARYIEHIDKGELEELRRTLTFILDCDVSLLEDNIEKGIWEKTSLDVKAFKDAGPYYDPKNNCRNDNSKTINQKP